MLKGEKGIMKGIREDRIDFNKDYLGESARLTFTQGVTEVNSAEINLSQLQRNISIIRRNIKPGTQFMAVLKGNAYGHGLIQIAYEVERCRCDSIGVVRVTEALKLREAGISIPIIMLAPIMPEQADYVVNYDVTISVDNECILKALQESCDKYNKVVNVHIKVNTGLNRYGIEPKDACDFINMIKGKYPSLIVEGIYTHFRDAEFDNVFTELQIERFNNVLNKLEKEKLRPQIAHAAGSAGILLYPKAHYDMVRCGLILYGLELNEEQKLLLPGMRSLMTIKSRVVKIEEVKKDDFGGYGNRFKASRNSFIAVIGAGYGDGISRGWKEVLISGRRIPIINYCMDGIIVDITDFKGEVNEFDEVIIIGKQGDETITWEEACYHIKCFSDEQLQRITARVPKNYFYEGEVIKNN